MITISFQDQPLHDTCVDLGQAEQAFGTISAAALVNFISDALAFENVGELADFLGDDIKFTEGDSLSVAIGSEHQAILVVAGKRFVRDAAGQVDWSTVTRLKLVQILRLP